MTRTHRLFTAVLMLALLAPAACAPADQAPETATPPAASEGATSSGSGAGAVTDGASLVAERCTVCHDMQRIDRVEQSRAEWEATVDSMIAKGTQLNDEERQAVIDYLASR